MNDRAKAATPPKTETATDVSTLCRRRLLRRRLLRRLLLLRLVQRGVLAQLLDKAWWQRQRGDLEELRRVWEVCRPKSRGPSFAVPNKWGPSFAVFQPNPEGRD